MASKSRVGSGRLCAQTNNSARATLDVYRRPNTGKSGEPPPRAGGNERKGYSCPGESSFRDLAPTFSFAVLVNFFQDAVIFLGPRISQYACGRTRAAWSPSWWRSGRPLFRFDNLDLDFDFLALGDTEVFVELNG